MDNPRTFYQTKIQTFKTQEKNIRHTSNLYLAAKLSAFCTSAYFGYLSFTAYSHNHLILALLMFIIYLYLYVKDDNCRKRMELLARMQRVCEHETASLQGDFSHFQNGAEYIDSQHEFSFDLDLFGENSLFHRINRTITQKGSDRLAHKLSHLFTEAEAITRQQEAIQELSAHTDWRIRFMAHPYISNHLEQLSTFIQNNQSSHFFVRSLLPYLIVSATIGSFTLALTGVLSWHYFEALFLLNLLISTLFRKTLNKTNLHVEKLHKDFIAYRLILNDIHQADFQAQALQDIRQKLFGGKTDSLQAFHELSRILNLFNLRGSDVIYITFNGFLLFDVLLIKCFMPWCRQHLPHIEQWLDSIAEMDALVSMSNYAWNHPTDTYAEILNEATHHVIQAEEVSHPFLDRSKAVPNSFTLSKQNIAIVTGANMAGKSTFLRTIGISYILANNGMPVCARTFRFSIVSLFSSMRTTDDLTKDISYFHAELLRLKQLTEHVQSHPFTLIILDEILKGTNSKDKLEGSILFLREISLYPVSAIIATHDLELAKLEKENGQLYSNYRFEIELSSDIRYTYKIEKGIAQNLNASYLLSNMLKELKSKTHLSPLSC